MKTLIIHPFDSSTNFLKEIYNQFINDENYTILNHNVSKQLLKKYIKEHDRIIMMGHGTNLGLIGYGRFIINSELVYLLREKECICIWCYAKGFFDKYQLKGFCTDMMVSEYEEALLCSVSCKYENINESNILFSKSLKSCISLSPTEIHKIMQNVYNIENNNIVQYNRERLFYRE